MTHGKALDEIDNLGDELRRKYVDVKAFKCYQLAADSGHMNAINSLVFVHMHCLSTE